MSNDGHSKIKILFVIHDLSVGGAEKVLINLVNNMDYLKFDVTVLALFDEGVNKQFLNSKIKYRYAFRHAIRGNSHYMKLLSPKQLYRWLVSDEYDIVISYLEGPSARIVAGCPKNKTKIVSWIHCTYHNKEELAKSLFYTLLYENVMPMDIRINEDVLMNYWLFKAADSAVYEDFCPYHYILRKDSAATSILNEHKLKDPVRVMRIIQQDSKDIPEVKEVVEERLTRQLIAISILSVKKQGELIRPFRKEIRNELRTKLKLILSNSYMSKSVKIRAGWVVLFPDSYCWFHTLYAKITGLDKKYKIE